MSQTKNRGRELSYWSEVETCFAHSMSRASGAQELTQTFSSKTNCKHASFVVGNAVCFSDHKKTRRRRKTRSARADERTSSGLSEPPASCCPQTDHDLRGALQPVVSPLQPTRSARAVRAHNSVASFRGAPNHPGVTAVVTPSLTSQSSSSPFIPSYCASDYTLTWKNTGSRRKTSSS